MRRTTTGALAVALFAITCGLARAASTDLTPWFVRATAYQSGGTATTLRTPDFMRGNSLKTMYCGDKTPSRVFLLHGIWELNKYDRKHRIGLASAQTDQCSVALFRASPPSVSVPNADLSGYSTGRGVRIGTTFERVRTLYGGPARRGAHFVASYSAQVPSYTVTIPRKRVNLDQLITLVIDDDRVSAITIYVDESGMF